MVGCDDLDSVDDASVTDIKGVHDEDEDDGLENGLAHVLEGESEEEELSDNEGYYFSGGNSHHH